MNKTAKANLHLVTETGIEETSEADWVEEIDESTLPPNAWQDELDSLIRLEHEVWEERVTATEEPTPEN